MFEILFDVLGAMSPSTLKPHAAMPKWKERVIALGIFTSFIGVLAVAKKLGWM